MCCSFLFRIHPSSRPYVVHSCQDSSLTSLCMLFIPFSGFIPCLPVMMFFPVRTPPSPCCCLVHSLLSGLLSHLAVVLFIPSCQDSSMCMLFIPVGIPPSPHNYVVYSCQDSHILMYVVHSFLPGLLPHLPVYVVHSFLPGPLPRLPVYVVHPY